MLTFLWLVNKQGQPRIIQYYGSLLSASCEEKRKIQHEVIKKCLSRSDSHCSFFDYGGNGKVIYRKYATLYFIVGAQTDVNELSVLEFIHNIVETFDKYFEKVCELDIMFHLDKCHMILNEMIVNGKIVETNKSKILAPIYAMDNASR